MISIVSQGSFKNTESFLKKNHRRNLVNILNRYGQKGVAALAAATPSETGETARSWYCEIETVRDGARMTWHNSHMAGNTPVVVLIQYGHGTGTGGYVQGRDFINPAIRPIFDQIANDVWMEVTNA
jgi:hypothetical protein